MHELLDTKVVKTGKLMLAELFKDPRHWLVEWHKALEVQNALSNPTYQNMLGIIKTIDKLRNDRLSCDLCDNTAVWVGSTYDDPVFRPYCEKCKQEFRVGGVKLKASEVLQYCCHIDKALQKKLIKLWKVSVGLNQLTPTAIRKLLPD